MYYIKLEDDMTLVKTQIDTIYLGDNIAKKVTFLLPETVGDDEIDTKACYVYLQYIRADGVANIVLLDRQEELYEDMLYQFTFPMTTEVTKYAGTLKCQLQIYSDLESGTAILTSGMCMLQISEAMNMDYYMPNLITYAFHQMKSSMDSQITETNNNLSELQEVLTATNEDVAGLQESVADIETQVDALTVAKADSLTFNTDTGVMQLTSQGEPVGDPVTINVESGNSISDVSLTTDGELVIFFTDGTFRNVGTVRGADGKVYVPHIDDSILTFTIEDRAGDIPDPVDLNPDDDWSDDTDTDYGTDYTWDEDDDGNDSGIEFYDDTGG